METKRIRLVPPSMDLVPSVVEAIRESETELREHLVWVSASLADPEHNMRTAIKNFDAHENELRFHILDVETAKLIGTAALLVRNIKVPFYEVGALCVCRAWG